MDFHKFDFFINNGKRIRPKLTNDWKIGVSLKEGMVNISSLTLKMSFDIPEIKLLEDIALKNISFSENNILIGYFIFNKNREIVDEYSYKEWLDKYNDIKRNTIKKSKLVKGTSYLLEDNSKVFFLGTKYISTFKGTLSRQLHKTELTHLMFTPISKRYLFSNEKGDVFEIHTKMILSKSDITISPSKINKLVYKFHCRNPFIAYFRDDCPIIKKYIYDHKEKCFLTEVV